MKPSSDLQVPDVRGMAASDAVRTLSNAGFSSRASQGTRAGVPDGTVFDQDPHGGEMRPRGTVVTIFVQWVPR